MTEAKGIGRSRLRKSGAMSEGGSRNGLRFLLDPILEVVASKLTTHHRPEMRTTETFAEVLNLLHRSVCCSQTSSPSVKAEDDAPQLTPCRHSSVPA